MSQIKNSIMSLSKNFAVLVVVISVVMTFSLGLISITLLSEYGWTLFFITPLFTGFVPVYLYGRRKEIGLRKSLWLGIATLLVSSLGLLVFAIEGLICIAMTLPLAIPITIIGSYVAYFFSAKKWANPTNTTIILLLIAIGTMSFDVVNKPTLLIPVKTSIVVDADVQTVWNHVVTFNKIDEPTDWIFKTGISYPTDATIEGTGVGAIRYCNFITGSFVEPITAWEEPHLLQFDVTEQPIPMNEFNPFWDIHPKHLDGYFLSKKGQFKLTELEGGQTELEGTTWYQVDITPERYWKTWSDFIIHRIHFRVLDHIKEAAEGA